jgi:hypothetical protein
MFATVLWAAPTHRQPPGRPRLHQPFLPLVCGADLSTWRGAVPPLVEAEALPLDCLPGDVVPGPRQGAALCFGSSPLTPRFPLQEPGPTSASPGCSSSPGLLRASSSPTASGWPLLRGVTGLPEGRWRVRRSPFPWLASVGRCAPPGVVAVQTGQSRRRPVPSPGPLWLQRVSLVRWCACTMALYTFADAAPRCRRDGIPGVRLPGSAVSPRFSLLRTSRRPGG